MPDEEQYPPTVETDETTKKLTLKEELPQSVPGFRLLQKLGEGGMGEVFEAEQLDPVRRRVALKLIKRGMESKEVLARFDSERQALALMSHPNIAQVYDAGTTSDGRPYFVMEFVQGVSVTQYCDSNRLTTQERLELFTQICEGVQHAHHKGVIHRDIKPSNVLVKIQDSKLVPKIIDFGVAKAITQRLTEQTLFTAIGEFIGTPEYMSPEQAEMTELDIDTRTDVYSLGVVLYEMLVGAQPFDARELQRSGFDEMRRKIREEDPPRPSARLSGLGEKSTAAANNRRLEPSTLARQLHGDLDWITMKAIEKDRTRRYDSPGELAADINRHLRHEPVLAGPPSATYRVKKFVRRHALGVAASALVVLALILGIAGTTVGMIRARNAEQAASREAKAAQEVSDFLVNLFEASSPEEARGASFTALQILERGGERISEELVDQPLTQARLQATIGSVYEKMGLYDEAVPLVEGALKTRRRLLGEEHLDVAQSARQLGELHRLLGNHLVAEPYLNLALRIREQLLGPFDPAVALSLNSLAVLYEKTSRLAEAEPLYRRALEIQEEELGPDHMDLAISLTNLAILMARQGEIEESEPLFRRVLEIERKEFGEDHPRVALSHMNLAIALKMQEKYDEAEPLYRRAIEIQEKVLGPKHPALAVTIQNLANIYLEQGRYDEAQPLYDRSLAISEEALGRDHPKVGRTLGNLAGCYIEQGNYVEAEALVRRALEIQENVFGSDQFEVATNYLNLAKLLHELARYDEAETSYRRSLTIFRQILDPDHPQIRSAVEVYAELLRTTGRSEEASELEAEAGTPE